MAPATAATATARSCASSPRRNAKRKPTRGWYALQQAEKKALVASVRLLEARKAFISGSIASNAVALAKQQREADALRAALRQQRLAVAAAQSVVTHFSALTWRLNPIERYIELGASWHERVATLLALRPQALRDGERYMRERMTSFAARPTCAFSSSKTFTLASGDACVAAFDMAPLAGVASVTQAHDALLSVLDTLEILWTEVSSDLMVREGSCGFQNADGGRVDPDDGGVGATLHHFVIATPGGVQVESKSAMFSEYAPASDTAVVCANVVDHDELSPYSPETRLRQDVSSAIVLRSFPARRRGGGDEAVASKSPDGSKEASEPEAADRVVVMARYYFVRYPNAPARRLLPRPRRPAAQASSVCDGEDPTFGFSDCFRIMTNAIVSIANAQQQQQAKNAAAS